MSGAVRVKICGVTRLEDALAACAAGADALGFNFWPGSRRFIAPADAREIVRRLPPLVTTVGVFVDPTRDEAASAAAVSGVQVIQLHGDEPPELCARLPLPVVKALRVSGPEALEGLERWPAAALLLDAPAPGYGGSGRTFDWTLAREAAGRARIILAGGLTPANVAAAIRAVGPYAVDVASGVESAPGIKDLEALRRFVAEARAAAAGEDAR